MSKELFIELTKETLEAEHVSKEHPSLLWAMLFWLKRAEILAAIGKTSAKSDDTG